MRITHTAEFEAELLAALARKEGTVIEVTLDPEVISTRGTLSAITQHALAQLLQNHSCLRPFPKGGSQI